MHGQTKIKVIIPIILRLGSRRKSTSRPDYLLPEKNPDTRWLEVRASVDVLELGKIRSPQ